MQGPLAILVLLSISIKFAIGSNILFILLDPGKSHASIFAPILKGLLERGHNITAICNNDFQINSTNYTQVLVLPKFKNMEFLDMKKEATRNLTECHYSKQSLRCYEKYHKELIGLFAHGDYSTGYALKSKNVRNFVKNNNDKYDIIVSELFVEEAMYMLAHKYNAPLALISPFDYDYVLFGGLGTFSIWSHIPALYGSYDKHLNIFSRISNKLITYAHVRNRKKRYLPGVDKMANKFFKKFAPLPTILEIESKVGLALFNTLKILDKPQQDADGIIDIAQIHMPKPKPLPDEIQKFLDEATKGAIYFGFGSMAQISKMPEEKIQAFVDVFVKLGLRVLWKFEDETWKFPENIMIKNWLPQNDILAHKNLKLFISHGGTLGVIESTYHGVPMLAIPVFGDHFLNAIKVVESGIGLSLRLEGLTYENILETATKLLTDQKYRDNVQKLSKKFKERPVDSLTKTLNCLEFYLKYNRTCDLPSPKNNVPWYEVIYLDLILAFGIMIAIIIYIALYVYKKAREFFTETVMEFLNPRKKTM